MKTFFNLIQEVQKPGLCHHCGGCVTFCTAINYGALALDDNGRPQFKDPHKCIECGICYEICPEITELDDLIKANVAWSAPLGRVIETTVLRARDRKVRERGTDGGVVTGLLLHLLNMGRIDGAIVTRPVGLFNREPWLATTPEDILEAAGFHFDASHGMSLFSDHYSTYSPSLHELGPLNRRKLERVAFVGTPCQIKAIRKMEALKVVPTDKIKYHLGLFCTGNFSFDADERRKLEEIGKFKWEEVRKINVKQELLIHLQSGYVQAIPLDQLDFMKREACRYCDDYSAEYADLSFGGIGAREGWTTTLARSPLGRAVLAEAREEAIEEFAYKDHPRFATQALETVTTWSEMKRAAALKQRAALGPKAVAVGV